MIRSLKNRFAPTGSFNANVITLMTGTTIAQTISLAVSPLLSRYYNPDEFGNFALFMAIATLLSVVSTGRYEFAIVLAESDEDAINVLFLSLVIVFFISLVSVFILPIVKFFFNRLLGSEKIGQWVYLIPGYVLVTGAYQCMTLWNNRLKRFEYLSNSRITLSTGTAIISLLLGYLQSGASGLILGAIVGQTMATGVICWYSIREKKIKHSSFCFNKMKKLANKYSNFPKINVVHAFIDNLNASGIIFIVTYYFDETIVGYYSFMMRVLQAPIGLVSSSLSQVFYQRASETYTVGGNLVGLINRLLKRLAIFSLIPALLLLSGGPQLFAFVFGDKWEIAGIYAQLLTPYMIFYFIISPLTLVPFIVQKQKQSLLVSAIGNSLFFVSIIIGAMLFNRIEVALLIYNILFIIYFFCYRKWIMMISVEKYISYGQTKL